MNSKNKIQKKHKNKDNLDIYKISNKTLINKNKCFQSIIWNAKWVEKLIRAKFNKNQMMITMILQKNMKYT